MAEPAIKPGEEATPPLGFPTAPKLRRIDFADLTAALGEGWRDFMRAPLFGLFFAGVYVAAGFALIAILYWLDAPVAIIPLAIAFPLLGPFVAVGLYEVSRRLSAGEPLSWSGVLGVVFSQTRRELVWMAFVMLFIFWIWAYQVRLLIALFIGSAPLSSPDAFFTALTTTGNGLTFLGVGSMIGVVLGLALFSVTVIATPMLLDREVDIVTAMVSSVTVVRRSGWAMLAWAVFVWAAMLLALAPMFLGLFIVLPVLGHATWRLYERAAPRGA